jgi:CubicO group peptidase (beta-lactamase class C family)
MLLRIATLIILVASAIPAAAQTPDGANSESRVDAIFKSFDKPTSPGCAVAAYQDDRILYRRAYGMANLD